MISSERNDNEGSLNMPFQSCVSRNLLQAVTASGHQAACVEIHDRGKPQVVSYKCFWSL